MQIKPVLTLDSNVLNMLGEHFEVSKKYLSNTASTQTLVDEISQYGFYKAQGKEAPIVFLVLGADKSSSGAARWAVDEPNMMNVAATRAKEEFYIIGDKSLYLNLSYDVATDTYRIIEQHKNSI